MGTFYIETFGCRATQADTAAMAASLCARGYRAGQAEAADVIVVNTCTVTREADAQARQAIRALHRLNPGARIIVTGCYAQRAPDELAALEGVSWVVGHTHRLCIPDLLETGSARGFVPLHRLAAPAGTNGRVLVGDPLAEPPPLVAGAAPGDRTRPTLKVQDGCNYRCTFCIIPQVRGRSRSLPPAEVVAQVRQLVASGAREIVLSGINLGRYGRDLAPRTTLAELLERLLAETTVERLRLSSLEPIQITADLVRLLASSDRIARHFHIPLQSGSDRVLAAMHRWYRTAQYRRRVELILEQMPEAAIGADVIAGFPGETEEDHQTTLAFIASLPLAYLHVFPFSPRPGTPAAARTDLLPASVVHRRARELRRLGEEKAAAFRRRNLGRCERALTLDRQARGCTEALTGNYLRVLVPDPLPPNRWIEVRLEGEEGKCLRGRILAGAETL
jgi:threonylcarbamoyladenosine tRNA methylthiotransferase MtaB